MPYYVRICNWAIAHSQMILDLVAAILAIL